MFLETLAIKSHNAGFDSCRCHWLAVWIWLQFPHPHRFCWAQATRLKVEKALWTVLGRYSVLSNYYWEKSLPSSPLGFPGGSDDKEFACKCGRSRFDPWVWKICWRREWQPTPAFLSGEFHGQRRLAGYSPWGCRVGHDWVTNTHLLHIALWVLRYLWGTLGHALTCHALVASWRADSSGSPHPLPEIWFLLPSPFLHH